MVRNLRSLVAAATTLAVFGTLGATAHAAEEFHCSVAPCTWTLLPDEKAGEVTAHQVFVVKGRKSDGTPLSASFTCDQLGGTATSEAKTTSELTFTSGNLKYKNSKNEQKCKVGASETVEINFTSCDYGFKSTNGAISTAELHLRCEKLGDGVDIYINSVLCLKITPFTAKGLGYHDSFIGGAKNIITATMNVPVPVGAIMMENPAHATCKGAGLGETMSTIDGATFTTGNMLITSETDSISPVMAEASFE